MVGAFFDRHAQQNASIPIGFNSHQTRTLEGKHNRRAKGFEEGYYRKTGNCGSSKHFFFCVFLKLETIIGGYIYKS